jgi:hypothetical protein
MMLVGSEKQNVGYNHDSTVIQENNDEKGRRLVSSAS